MKRIFAYGSIKRGFYNHEIVLSKAKFIDETYVWGYTLYDTNHGYPVAIPTDIQTTKITGERFDIDEESWFALLRMEINAGYSVEYNIDLKAYIFYIPTIEDAKKYYGKIVKIGETWVKK